MPRQTKTLKTYEKKKKNPISLLDDSNIAKDLKPLKVGDKNSILELSENELRIRGTINADAINVNGSAVQTGTDAGATELAELSDVSYSSNKLEVSGMNELVVG